MFGNISRKYRLLPSQLLQKDEASEGILEAGRGVVLGEVNWVSPQVKARLNKKSDGWLVLPAIILLKRKASYD
jgi:hypothetical protein